MGNYQPHLPRVLGLDWGPLYRPEVPLDTGSAYGQTFRSTVPEPIAFAWAYFTSPPIGDYQFHLMAEVYPKGAELATGGVRRTIVPVNGGTINGSVLLQGGAANMTDALSSVADGKYLTFNSGGQAKLEFATGGLFAGKRILRLILHHSITQLDPGLNPNGGALLVVESALNPRLTILGRLVADFNTDLGPIRATNLGEINPQSQADPYVTTARQPWNPASVQQLDTANLRLFMLGDSYSIRYCALEVVWCEESRLAVGATRYSTFNLTSGALPWSAIANVGFQIVTLYSPTGVLGWAKPGSGEFSICFRLADGGNNLTTPDALAVDTEQYGGVPSIALGDSFAPLSTHEGRHLLLSADNDPIASEPTTAMASVLLHDAVFNSSPDPHSYDSRLIAPVYSTVYAIQEIVQSAPAANTPFPWVRFWARRYGEPAGGLIVSCGGQVITLTPADFDALPEIIDGWRYVTMKFPAAPLLGSSGALTSVTFAAGVDAAHRWEILGARFGATGGGGVDPTYGGTAAAATHDGLRDSSSDLSVSLAMAAPAVSGLSAAPASYPVTSLGLACGIGADCLPTAIGLVRLTWGAVAASGFSYYEVQRKDPNPKTNAYATIGKVTDRIQPNFADFEARRGVVSTYQVRVVRDDGTPSDWSAPATGTPPAPTGGSAALVFTSNVDPRGSVAYTESWEGEPQLDFAFPEADTRQLLRLYQRDMQMAFRPSERGGAAFNRLLLIASGITTGPPGAVYGQAKYGVSTYGAGLLLPPDQAFDRLRDLAWDPNLPYVCVLDERGGRWLANINVPSGNVRPGIGLYLAQIAVTETTATPSTGDRSGA